MLLFSNVLPSLLRYLPEGRPQSGYRGGQRFVTRSCVVLPKTAAAVIVWHQGHFQTTVWRFHRQKEREKKRKVSRPHDYLFALTKWNHWPDTDARVYILLTATPLNKYSGSGPQHQPSAKCEREFLCGKEAPQPRHLNAENVTRRNSTAHVQGCPCNQTTMWSSDMKNTKTQNGSKLTLD